MKKIIILFFIFILTGCYDYKELDDLAIVSGIYIYLDNNNYVINMEIVDTNDNAKSSIIYTGSDTSFYGAYRDIIKNSSLKLYFGHLDILVMDEDIAKSDISILLDFLERDKSIRDSFYVLICNDKNILNNNGSTNILNILEENKKYLGFVNAVTFQDLVSNYLNPNIDIVIPSIKLSNDRIILSNYGIFKNNMFIGYLDEEDGVIYNLVMNTTNNASIKLNYDNNYYFLDILNTKVKYNIVNNTIIINIYGSANVKEYNDNYHINMNNVLNTNIYNSIDKVINKYNSDIYGFRDKLYKNNYEYWDKIRLDDIEIKINNYIRFNNMKEDIYVR